MGISYLFISHDLGVVEHISDRVLVLEHGRIVKRGKTASLSIVLDNPSGQSRESLFPRCLPFLDNAVCRTIPRLDGHIASLAISSGICGDTVVRNQPSLRQS
ncbi:hypothetical protein SS05631_a42130 (plasmid) [Sinorhizobium sp. CCBAU 05631]|nr:hypothetical protein SS05631_a42130 [Sinorhizobium sp. CCBAU 05631]